MFKLLFIGAVLYYAYRFIIAPAALDDEHRQDDRPRQNTKPNYEDDYVDYEEVD